MLDVIIEPTTLRKYGQLYKAYVPSLGVEVKESTCPVVNTCKKLVDLGIDTEGKTLSVYRKDSKVPDLIIKNIKEYARRELYEHTRKGIIYQRGPI